MSTMSCKPVVNFPHKEMARSTAAFTRQYVYNDASTCQILAHRAYTLSEANASHILDICTVKRVTICSFNWAYFCMARPALICSAASSTVCLSMKRCKVSMPYMGLFRLEGVQANADGQATLQIQM